MQVTVVPRPTAESSFTVPPCSSTKERTIERPSPAPRCSEPSAWLSKRSNTRSLIVGRNAGAAVGHAEDDRVVAPLDRQPHHLARRREADRVGQEVEQDLAHAPLVGHEAADVGRGAHVEQDRLLGDPVLQAEHRGIDRGADVDLFQVERHRAGVDGREIEDVVDDREQRARRLVDASRDSRAASR